MKNETYRFYYTCPYCGANLDHGERCDCRYTITTKDGKTGETSEIKADIIGHVKTKNQDIPLVNLKMLDDSKYLKEVKNVKRK